MNEIDDINNEYAVTNVCLSCSNNDDCYKPTLYNTIYGYDDKGNEIIVQCSGYHS